MNELDKAPEEYVTMTHRFTPIGRLESKALILNLKMMDYAVQYSEGLVG